MVCTFSLSSPWLACRCSFSLTFKRQLKMPSGVQHVMPVQPEQRTATKLFHLILVLKKKVTHLVKPTGIDQVNGWGQSETEHPWTREKKGVRKRGKIWFLSKVILMTCYFFSTTSWAEAPKQHSHPNNLSWFHQPMKVYLKFNWTISK